MACSLKNTAYLRCEMWKYFILTCSIVISLFSEKKPDYPNLVYYDFYG